MLGKICTSSKILKASSRHRAEAGMYISHMRSSDSAALFIQAERGEPGTPGKRTCHIFWNHGWLVTALKDNNTAQRPVFIFSLAFMFWTRFCT